MKSFDLQDYKAFEIEYRPRRRCSRCGRRLFVREFHLHKTWCKRCCLEDYRFHAQERQIEIAALYLSGDASLLADDEN